MDLTILKELANENVTAIFDAFGLDYIDKYEYLQMTCPIHGGDNPTAFSWVKDRGYFRCFTRHCERNGADIFDFVQKYKNCSFERAKQIVESICVVGEYEEASEQEMAAELAFKKYIKNNAKLNKQMQVYDPAILKRLKAHSYLIDRGFDKDLLESYNVGYCDNPNSRFFRRLCIPVMSDTGSLVGFTARAVFDWEKESQPKWIHTHGMQKSELLFNMHRAREHIRNTHKAILVEGPLDVFKLEMSGINNAVAVLGSDLSGPQRSLLLENECYDLILAFDDDEAGTICTNKTKKSCKNYFNLYKYVLPTGRDIGDLEVEMVKKLDIIVL
jgi:DNA primase